MTDYRQPALVEAFVSGPEYTVTLIGNAPPIALPAIQRALERETGIGLHALEGPGAAGQGSPLEHDIDGVLEPALEARMAAHAIRAFEALECRDFARVDFRLDAHGEPIFLEINPLPTFATDGTFAILAELEGCSLSEMLGRCVSGRSASARSRPRRLGTRASRRDPAMGGGIEMSAAAQSVARRPERRSRWPLEASRPPKGVSAQDWSDWGWQMRHRIRDARGLREWIDATPEEESAIESAGFALPFRDHAVLRVADGSDRSRTVRSDVRSCRDRRSSTDEAGLADPLDEVAHSPVKNVIRVYPDRIAFCVNNECALYCRYCLRKRMVGRLGLDDAEARARDGARLDRARRPEIRDVLLTGGDPLVFSDARLEWLLGRLRAIPHVELIRLGTRLPVTLPFRVTERALPDARALSSDLGQHAFQSSPGAHRRRGGRLRSAAARRDSGRQPERAAARA